MVTLVILSVSEESRMVTLNVLFTGSFTAARFRMTACFSSFPPAQQRIPYIEGKTSTYRILLRSFG